MYCYSVIVFLLRFAHFISLRMVHRRTIWQVTYRPSNLMCLTICTQTNVSLCYIQVLTFSLHSLVPSTKGSVGGDAESLTWLNDLRWSGLTCDTDVPAIKNEKKKLRMYPPILLGSALDCVRSGWIGLCAQWMDWVVCAVDGLGCVRSGWIGLCAQWMALALVCMRLRFGICTLILTNVYLNPSPGRGTVFSKVYVKPKGRIAC